MWVSIEAVLQHKVIKHLPKVAGFEVYAKQLVKLGKKFFFKVFAHGSVFWFIVRTLSCVRT